MREGNETRLGCPPPPSGSFARGRLFTYKSQDTSCLRIQVCTFVSKHAHECKSLHEHVSITLETQVLRRHRLISVCVCGGGRWAYKGRAGTGRPCSPQMPAQPVPRMPLASGSSSCVIFQPWLVLRRELYLQPSPWFSAFPRGPLRRPVSSLCYGRCV